MEIERFLAWFNSSGVDIGNICVRHSHRFGFGLYTSQPLLDEKNQLVLSIPEHLFIKPSVAENLLTGFEQLVVYLLESKDEPYVDLLRSIPCVPRWRFSPDEIFPRQLATKMTKHQAKYCQSKEKFHEWNDEQFQWAYYTVNTRCVHLDLERESKDQDENLCLIPYLDFVNHSTTPNTFSSFNTVTRSYEIRTLRPIVSVDEQITFMYNPHSNIDLFIEYGFVLLCNPYNELNIEFELEHLLTSDQVQTMKAHNYWSTLELFPGDNDFSWTLLKAIELIINQQQWSPYDDPPPDDQQRLGEKIKELLTIVRENVEREFQQWTTKDFSEEKKILYQDFMIILDDNSVNIDKAKHVFQSHHSNTESHN